MAPAVSPAGLGERATVVPQRRGLGALNVVEPGIARDRGPQW